MVVAMSAFQDPLISVLSFLSFFSGMGGGGSTFFGGQDYETWQGYFGKFDAAHVLKLTVSCILVFEKKNFVQETAINFWRISKKKVCFAVASNMQ